MGHGKAIIALAASAGLFLSSGAGVSGSITQGNTPELSGTERTSVMTGEGSVEGYVNLGMMKVILPAVDVNFIVDPDGLVKSSGGASYRGATFDYRLNGQMKNDGFVFFKKTSGSRTSYSTSVDLDFQNKSSYPVKVSVSATYNSGNSGVSLSDPANYGETPQISFMLKDDSQGPTSIASAGSSFSGTLNGVPEAYCVKYNGSAYEYCLNEKKLGKSLPSYKIKLIGQCNPDADWSETDVSQSTLKVVWNITRDDSVQFSAPSIKNLNVSVDSKHITDVSLTLDYAGKSGSVSSVSYISGGRETVLSASQYSLSGTTLTISADAFKKMNIGSYIYKVVFGNGAADTVQIDVK
jgi:hypothetical protein